MGSGVGVALHERWDRPLCEHSPAACVSTRMPIGDEPGVGSGEAHTAGSLFCMCDSAHVPSDVERGGAADVSSRRMRAPSSHSRVPWTSAGEENPTALASLDSPLQRPEPNPPPCSSKASRTKAHPLNGWPFVEPFVAAAGAATKPRRWDDLAPKAFMDMERRASATVDCARS